MASSTDIVARRVADIVDVAAGSPAALAGILTGDGVVAVDGVVPRDILEWRRSVDGDDVVITVERDGSVVDIEVGHVPGSPIGLTVSSAVFDRVQTCDNHCEFCFIYQLPPGMRRSLYLKDDDYRLSFLFGNFTTLTRFTEADLERVIDERLSPLYVSVHATDPWARAGMLRNNRGGTSLRWLGALLGAGIDVHAQVVLCPGVNDGHVLDDTIASLVERYPGLRSVAVVPLGLSDHNTEKRMRVHTAAEASRVVDQIEAWQVRCGRALGRTFVHLSDEFYVASGRTFPSADVYEGFPMIEDGVGMVREFLDAFESGRSPRRARSAGFFGDVDARSGTDYVNFDNPAADTGLRHASPVPVTLGPRRARRKRLVVVTGEYGSRIIEPLVAATFPGNAERLSVLTVPNTHFGGNTAVAGLLTFADISRCIVPDDDAVYLLPETCLNEGRFLDGATLEHLRAVVDVEVLPVDGAHLRHRIETHLGRGE